MRAIPGANRRNRNERDAHESRRVEQIGTIAGVQAPVVEIACPELPALHRALYACIDHERYTFEVHQHVHRRYVRAITLRRTTGSHS
jgi:F-type H+-transporting ATPase subunit beta